MTSSVLFSPMAPVNPFRRSPQQDQIDSFVCAQTDPELFFPETGCSNREAKKICIGCEYRAACLADALAANDCFGVWGGLSERDRISLKHRAAAPQGEVPDIPDDPKEPPMKDSKRRLLLMGEIAKATTTRDRGLLLDNSALTSLAKLLWFRRAHGGPSSIDQLQAFITAEVAAGRVQRVDVGKTHLLMMPPALTPGLPHASARSSAAATVSAKAKPTGANQHRPATKPPAPVPDAKPLAGAEVPTSTDAATPATSEVAPLATVTAITIKEDLAAVRHTAVDVTSPEAILAWYVRCRRELGATAVARLTNCYGQARNPKADGRGFYLSKLLRGLQQLDPQASFVETA